MQNKQYGYLKEVSRVLFSRKGPHKKGMWRGVRAIKYPTDLAVYAEIIYKQKPDLVIETGTRFGGSALFLADACNVAGHGKVITIEISEDYELQKHPRLVNLRGSSTATHIIEEIESEGAKSALVILDSDHSPEHIAKEMELYKRFIQTGGYMVVEDLWDEGGYKSVKKFLKKNPNFKIDFDAEKYGIHAAAGGFLRRVV